MASNKILEAATAAAALAASSHPMCPSRSMLNSKYHEPDACLTKPSRLPAGHMDRGTIYNALKASGAGASLVPDTQTVFCPLGDVASLESPSAVKGFDTTWIVENTSSRPVVLAWVSNGMERSPFDPNLSPMEDPKATLQPGDWTSVPTFESYVYHAREIDDEGIPGNVVLQHRAGMIPLGRNAASGVPHIDPEPFSPESVGTGDKKPQLQEVGRNPTGNRPCNVIDVGFRNEAGFPLSVYWADNLVDVPVHGFNCAEKYKFHMGVKSATQDFMWDWGSKTKYEGSFIGHTFVARKADDPSIVVDKFTIAPTRIIDCPSRKQKQVITAPAKIGAAAGVQDPESCSNDDETDDGNNLPYPFEGNSAASRAAAGLSGVSG